MKLRSYQEQAVQKTLFHWLPNNDGGALIVMPTGTGKSIVIADIIRIVMEYPGQRVIVATHSQELVEQDYLEFMELCPFANAGILCAGLGEKNTTAPILFVSIQSAYDKAFKIGKCDILMADEAHGISRNQDTMWGEFIKNLRICSPQMRLIGLTATGYRLDSGHLIGGKDAMFHGISYEYSILEAIQEGYLCELVPKKMATKIDISKVHIVGGEYKPGELEDAYNIDEITKAIVDELIEYGANRQSWIMFGAGVAHCEAIAAEIRSRGVTAQAITIKTKKKDRREFIEKHKSGEIRCLVSMKVLTTGYNNKRVDLIGDACPTKSKGLHVQKLGRGTRCLYADNYRLDTKEGRLSAIADGPKPNCLVLDWARNGARFGPIDQIHGDPNREKGSGDAPVKVCPNVKCQCVMFAGTMECPDCGYIFPEKPVELETVSGDDAILSTQIDQTPEWHEVLATRYSRHKGKDGKTDTFKATYSTLTGPFSEYICIEHSGFAREKACLWHRRRLPDIQAPNSIDEALKMPYPDISAVCIKKNGKFWEVINVKIGPKKEIEVLEETPIYKPAINWDLLDEEIPF